MQENNVDTIERGVCYSKDGCCAKLHVTDWMQDIQPSSRKTDLVEVRFKNTRKDYYENVNNLKLNVGDLVAVESSPGHDIGIVSLMGELVNLPSDNINIIHNFNKVENYLSNWRAGKYT